MADGCLHKNGRLRLVLADKDLDHLMRFAEFIEYGGVVEKRSKVRSSGVQAMHTEVALQLREIYGFSNTKTYEPCNIRWLGYSNAAFSLMIGFIDGDGCLMHYHNRNDYFLRVKLYRSWLDNLQFFSEIIDKYNWDIKKVSKPYINNQGYAQLSIGNNAIISGMKRKLLKLKLPVMPRKWDSIPTEYVGRRQKAEYNLKEVRRMVIEGKRNKFMAEKLGLCASGITAIMRRNNISWL